MEEDEQFPKAAKQVMVKGDRRTGQEIPGMLCGMSHEELLEVVKYCPASMLQSFWQNVPAHAVPAVVEIPNVSCG